ncbi:Quinone oxidoreductase 1 [Luteitalea pratensis]|uniref:Quinone oxidoreductase 1 n=2 Tax=Luteitalea pratensis TaxID=1855912 RepID=A0A143PVJ2_LUTPR|nr:NAD(P)-dependent alcohol dehydrogenase [Luteitalea pratensis]AMY12080.1 Quinone oxidoreductase 1 [Luteitalea pratensis]
MRVLRLLKWTLLVLPLVLVAIFAIAWWRSDNDCAARASSTQKVPMRALVYCDYGTPDVLTIAQVEKPVPQETQVLVRVRAASVNPVDWHMIRGTPYVMRIDSGLRKPAVTRTGVDFAGVVEAVGRQVSRFKVGDEVFGGRTGALAEYVVVSADRAIVHKPALITFDQAAAVGVAGLTALQGIRDRGEVRKGERVLINGASGGVGTFAVQIAKHIGAEVTGVCSTRNVDLVRSLGADHVIDYTKDDFTTRTAAYDMLLDNVGNRPLSACRRVLTPNGRYVLVGGGGPNDHRIVGPLGRVASIYLMKPFVRQEMSMFIADLNRRDLEWFADAMGTGVVSAVIDRRYPFAQAAEAMRYLESGRARGKVIVTMD